MNMSLAISLTPQLEWTSVSSSSFAWPCGFRCSNHQEPCLPYGGGSILLAELIAVSSEFQWELFPLGSATNSPVLLRAVWALQDGIAVAAAPSRHYQPNRWANTVPLPNVSAAEIDQSVQRKVGSSDLGKWGAHGPCSWRPGADLHYQAKLVVLKSLHTWEERVMETLRRTTLKELLVGSEGQIALS